LGFGVSPKLFLAWDLAKHWRLEPRGVVEMLEVVRPDRRVQRGQVAPGLTAGGRLIAGSSTGGSGSASSAGHAPPAQRGRAPGVHATDQNLRRLGAISLELL